MATLYRLFEDGELVGAYKMPEIARILNVTVNTAYDAYNKQRPIKKHFTIEPPEKEKIAPTDSWVTEKMAEWDEIRKFLNPKLSPKKEEPVAVVKKPEKRKLAARHSTRYSSSAVRFR